MAHTITDLSLKVTATLPNAANTVNSNSIDLGATTPFPITEKINVKISTTSAVGANTKNLNLRLQDSAEAAANFTNVAQTANPILRVAESGSVYAASEVVIALPPNVKRYIRVAALGEANGGDSSNGTFAVEVLT